MKKQGYSRPLTVSRCYAYRLSRSCGFWLVQRNFWHCDLQVRWLKLREIDSPSRGPNVITTNLICSFEIACTINDRLAIPNNPRRHVFQDTVQTVYMAKFCFHRPNFSCEAVLGTKPLSVEIRPQYEASCFIAWPDIMTENTLKKSLP